jgi:N-methylhydantoinase A
LGNAQPTVTDANVVLGFINGNSLAGGNLAIDSKLSEAAIRNHVGEPLGVPLADAAHGIRAVANAAMARAVRAVTVERGRDPRDLTLMAFGGNGGVHAPDLARQLGIPRVVIPPMSGIFSAIGMLAADIEHTALRTVGRFIDRMSASQATATPRSAPPSCGRPTCAMRGRPPNSPFPSKARISPTSANVSSPNTSRPTAIAMKLRSS